MTYTPVLAGGAELELALRATLLIGAAWAVAAGLHKAGASAATRHVAWLLGIAALLALPLFWWLAPPLRLPILRPEAVTAAAAALPASPVAASPTEFGALGWSEALLAAYLLGVAALLLRFAMCRRMIARLWRDAEPPRDAAWQDLLLRVSREMRLSRPVALRIARGPAMAMTWGTWAPKVLLPAEACAWPLERRRLVLLHEVAHVARCDSLGRSAASLACALYWFHPGAWFAARRMRLEQEYAADDRVLKAGAAARTYAFSLLDLAGRVGEKSWPDHAAAMAGMCQLERRLISITTPARRERPDPAIVYASALIAALFTLAVAAGVPVRPLLVLPESLRAEPDIPPPLVSEPDEGQPGSVAEMPASATGRRERGARNLRESSPESTPPVPLLQLEAPVTQVGPAAPAVSPVSREEAPAEAPRRIYGPPLPQQDFDVRDSDARLPEQVRRSDGVVRTQPVPPPSRSGASRSRLRVSLCDGGSALCFGSY